MQNTEVVITYLSTHANNFFAYYKYYQYFATYLSTKRESRIRLDFRKETCDELLARARRVILFTDKSKLQPVKHTKFCFGDLANRARKGMYCDHMSFWKSSRGTPFILNEPYVVDVDYEVTLAAVGLVAIELPVNLSPYCGQWDPKPNALPGTRSFLICDGNNSDELRDIDRRLELETLLNWNSLKGINHA
jgi:hypothetical protein